MKRFTAINPSYIDFEVRSLYFFSRTIPIILFMKIIWNKEQKNESIYVIYLSKSNQEQTGEAFYADEMWCRDKKGNQTKTKNNRKEQYYSGK